MQNTLVSRDIRVNDIRNLYMERLLLNLTFFTILSVLILPGCVRGLSEPDIIDPELKKVFVINQGTPGQNNPSLTVYNPVSNEIIQSAYQLANGRNFSGRPVDMFLSAGDAYILLQNQNGLEVIQTSNYKSRGNLSLQSFSPPDRVALNHVRTRAYISHSTDSIISVINLADLSLMNTIKVPGEPAGLSLVRNLLVITLYNRSEGNSILLYNVNTNEFKNEIEVGMGPFEVMTDFQDRIWVLCEGSFDRGIPGSLYRVDTDLFVASRWIQFPAVAARMTWDGSLYIYVIAGRNIQRVFTPNPNQVTSWLQAAEGTVLRGIQADGASGEVFTVVNISGQQNGELRHYNRSGELITSTPVGINPHRIIFEY